jgi:hypothetical protein
MGARLELQIEVPEALRHTPLPAIDAANAGRERHQTRPRAQARAAAPSGSSRAGPTARVAVTVADDGQGFSNLGGGSGIGLKNVRERLRLAYGPGFGVFPSSPTSRPGVAAAASRCPHPRMSNMPECVVAEDESLLRDAWCACWRKPGRNWRSSRNARTAEGAVEAIAQLQPDVAFLDIRMPGP